MISNFDMTFFTNSLKILLNYRSLPIKCPGTRLQAVSDATSGCVHRAYGINRFNGGTLTVTETNAVYGSTNSLDDALINIEIVSNTEYRVRLTFASNLGTSSFASGMIRGFALNDYFPTLTFAEGVGGVIGKTDGHKLMGNRVIMPSPAYNNQVIRTAQTLKF